MKKSTSPKSAASKAIPATKKVKLTPEQVSCCEDLLNTCPDQFNVWRWNTLTGEVLLVDVIGCDDIQECYELIWERFDWNPLCRHGDEVYIPWPVHLPSLVSAIAKSAEYMDSVATDEAIHSKWARDTAGGRLVPDREQATA